VDHIKHLSTEGLRNNRACVALGYVTKESEIVSALERYINELQVRITRLKALRLWIGLLGMGHGTKIYFGVRCSVYFNAREGIGDCIILPFNMT
jgi:hypothetical protein